jgi:L-aspartate oxidase
VETIKTDYLVIGAGVAGLRAAIELAEAGHVLVVAKESLRESASEYAQGGIAVALSDDDEVSLHEQDTLYAGDGLCDVAAVRTLVEEGPGSIQELIEWGTEFDREGSKLLFTREGAHSRNRILHAHGDSTGREIARTLYWKAASLNRVTFRSFAAMTDILLDETGAAAGALVYHQERGELIEIRAKAVLLATGGLGHVYLETTNPDVATGDGVAAAYRVGAEIRDLEFVQFHPTALHKTGAPRFLLSEALRGEGAYLRNQAGERFMHRYHQLEELAPRDVVSRSIVAQAQATGSEHVYLDLTHRTDLDIPTRFPRIFETCMHYGIDLRTQSAPVYPAVHYSMGGVYTDLNGLTTVPNLYAAGEVAATGVHGANRLASNSLLEGIVFGARTGKAMREAKPALAPKAPSAAKFPDVGENELRQLAWNACGVQRNAADLTKARDFLAGVGRSSLPDPTPGDYQARNIWTVVRLIADCALAREESRGGHFRTDFPSKDAKFEKHSSITRRSAVRFV